MSDLTPELRAKYVDPAVAARDAEWVARIEASDSLDALLTGGGDPVNATEVLAGVLAAHRSNAGRGQSWIIFPTECGCGEKVPGWAAFEAHVAAVQAEALRALIAEGVAR